MLGLGALFIGAGVGMKGGQDELQRKASLLFHSVGYAQFLWINVCELYGLLSYIAGLWAFREGEETLTGMCVISLFSCNRVLSDRLYLVFTCNQ